MAIGESGAGKSSLAVQWLAAGCAVYGDDIVLMNRDGALEPFQRLLSIHPHVARDQGLDLKRTTMWESGSEEAWIDPTPLAGWAGPAPVRAVVRVRYDPAAALTVETLKQTEALNLLLACLMPSGTSGGEAFDLLASAIATAECFVVRHPGGPQVGAGILKELSGA